MASVILPIVPKVGGEILEMSSAETHRTYPREPNPDKPEIRISKSEIPKYCATFERNPIPKPLMPLLPPLI